MMILKSLTHLLREVIKVENYSVENSTPREEGGGEGQMR